MGDSTKLAGILVGAERVFQYIAESIEFSVTHVGSGLSYGIANHPAVTGGTVVLVWVLIGLTIYAFAKGTRKLISGVGCCVLAIVLAAATVSVCLVGVAQMQPAESWAASSASNLTNASSLSGPLPSG